MREHRYTRRGAHIESVERNGDGTPAWQRACDSVNEAKRKSRELQLDADGALGRGSVQRGRTR